ncbi:unnamed protein product [Ilex paraguariensis]|uniref:Uncharacterized protein n=1 Tax=Ilex paraguariensis TaxID=185542 RepID=A0ABC8RS95_9AQUA
MGRAPCCDKTNVKKGPWSPEEDAKLKAYIDTYGTGGNWIALPQKIAQLPGRTDNDIKNYWNTRLKKKLLGRRIQSHTNHLSPASQNPKDENGIEESKSLSNSALERLQLHMQLQTLQNPLSSCNNPALWPKLHPLQEKTIQSLHLQGLNESSNPLMQQAVTPSNLQLDELDNSVIKSSSDSPIMFNNGSHLSNSTTTVPKSGGIEQSNPVIQSVSTFTQGDFDDSINNKAVGSVSGENQMAEFDCFKEMDDSKDTVIWWSNDFHTNSITSSNSWDSISVLHQPERFYQDYALGYSVQ